MTNVLEWLEATSRRLPQKVAVADPSSEFSFSVLQQTSKAVGTWLITHGVRPRTAVALYLEKSPLALTGMLGAVYAGGFYSVLDVRQTPVRLASIVEGLDPAVILTDAANLARAHELFDTTGLEIAALEDIKGMAADEVLLGSVRDQATDVDPLYVNFTSGSTGTPKGVVVSHRSVIDFIPQLDATFGIDESDVLANQAPFDFDVSVKDIYTGLLQGATVQLVPREYFVNPMQLMDYLVESRATTLIWAVSALCFVSIMGGLDYKVPATIRRVMFSGEVMPPKQLREWREYLPDAMYVNLYGPTEITCNCTYFVVDRDYGKNEVIPMGRPFANERVFLLDAQDLLVTEPGMEGEVCVSGTSLGLGYLNDPDRTAASFVQNPLNTRWLERIYRTGDLAAYNDDGDLVYASRKDNQIKHLGQRIELGDIEAAAQGVDGVSRACCLYDQRRKKLHLFYMGNLGKDELFEALKQALPQYMVPNKIQQIQQMPLTKNGKIDRKALGEMAKIK